MSNVIDMGDAAVALFIKRSPCPEAARYVIANGRSVSVTTRSGWSGPLEAMHSDIAKIVLNILKAIAAQNCEALAGSVSQIDYDDRSQTSARVLFSQGFLACQDAPEYPDWFLRCLSVGDSFLCVEFEAENEP